MPYRSMLSLLLFAAPFAAGAASAASAAPDAAAPRTFRLDYYHTGTATEEVFSLDRLVVEPLPWPGNPDRPLDDLNLGKYRFTVRDAASGKPLYSRGFASIYGEWETTGEARERHRTFHESLRFPQPAAPVEVVLEKRDAENRFVQVWEVAVDPADIFVDDAPPPRHAPIEVQRRGDPAHKVDLLLLGDGYTAAECGDFERSARHLTDVLFATAPFAARRDDWNVWAICPPAAESGVSRPSSGGHRRSPLGTTYDAFGSERYVLTFENRAWREVAAWAPYDFVEILVNETKYGGGGIFGLFSTAAAGNEWIDYLFIHEFGHHFAGLADEYYTSPVAYEPPVDPLEPWEVNATVHADPAALKWRDLVAEGTPVPSPWPKEEFEAHSREIQERRRQLIAEQRPDAEVSALFHEQQAFEVELFSRVPLAGEVGAFEGANYAALGTYRPQLDCIMFSRNPVPFCAVCQRGISQVIDLYTGTAAAAPTPAAAPAAASTESDR